MKRRSGISNKKAHRGFKRGANSTHKANITPRPQRGGGRL